jgi:hypothetical protein
VGSDVLFVASRPDADQAIPKWLPGVSNKL